MIASIALAVLLAQAAPEATLRRFALVAGANDGGPGRTPLRYATSDARAMARVLAQLGGVAEADLLELEDPTADQLGAALQQLRGRIAQAHGAQARTEVLFYYSGHSDEDGLLLKGQRLPYAALRERLEALGAEVRIAVLDSCASGALNRTKGGVARPAFLVDRSTQLSGHAFVTSASADEAAQESERLKASVFTHFFLSGLRGAADASRDGRVTLGEAYQYAFGETLARTTSTRAGPQRPGYDIQLVGTGDLVLTDVRAATAHLVLEAGLAGRVYVLGATGGLVVEVAKAPGKPVELGLEPGEYRVVVDDGQKAVGEARLTLASGDTRPLGREALGATTLEATALRGGAEERPFLPMDVAFLSPLGVAGLSSPRVHLGLGVIFERVGQVDGALLSAVAGWVDDRVTGAALGGVLIKAGGVTGAALSGVALVSTGDVSGLTASVVSVVAGSATGAQAAVLNLTTGPVTGLQLGVGNLAAQGLSGAQLGVVNTAFGPTWAGQVGVVNIGGDVTGAQVGVVNIAAHVSGAQVGVLNIAETSDAPVGILNIVTRGRTKVALWANETALANLGLKLGSEHVYTLLSLGYDPRGPAGRPTFRYGLGLGARALFGRFYGEVEASYEDLHQLPAPGAALAWEEGVFSTGLRVNAGYQLTEGVAVFVGPQLHVLLSVLPGRVLSGYGSWGFDLSPAVRLVPGAVAGVQFL